MKVYVPRFVVKKQHLANNQMQPLVTSPGDCKIYILEHLFTLTKLEYFIGAILRFHFIYAGKYKTRRANLVKKVFSITFTNHLTVHNRIRIII